MTVLHVRRIRLLEDDADESKHVGVLAIYKIMFIYIYMHFLVWIINFTKYTVHTSY
jgi:hypothetical protein